MNVVVKGVMCLLIAQQADGQLFSLLKARPRSELIKRRRRQTFYCPVCKQQVQLKLGQKKAWHFAHLVKQHCTFEAEAESHYHLQGKKWLYTWLRRKKVPVKLEAYLPELQQRPDLLLQTAPQLTALEFQCATMPPDLLKKRTTTFQQAGLLPIWLLGGNRLARTGRYAFRLSQMDWLALRPMSPKSSQCFLLYFCPESCQFATLTQITPISATKVFAHLKFYSLNQFSLIHMYRDVKQKAFDFPKAWLHLKTSWRQFAYRQTSPAHQYLRRFFDVLSFFPPVAGLPTTYLYMIETPCFLWQSWLFQCFYTDWPDDQFIKFSVIKRAFDHLVSAHIFKVRTLPFLPGHHYTDALRAYMDTLTYFGFVKKVGGDRYQKCPQPAFPFHKGHLEKLDRLYFTKWYEASKM